MPQWLTLRFTDPVREEAFLLWLVPRPRGSNSVLICITTATSIFFALSIDAFNSGRRHSVIASLVLLIVLIVADAVCVIWSRIVGTKTSQNAQLIRATDAIFCIFIANMVVVELALVGHAISMDCKDDVVLFADEQKVYREANCYRRFTLTSAPLLTFLPLKRMRFVYSLATAVVASFAMAIALAFWPYRYLSLTIGHAVEVIAILAFISFVHYLMERDARKYFTTHKLLEEYTEDMKERADALEKFVANLLPPELIARSSRKISAHKHDVSDEAVVLVMKVPDFAAQSTSWVPVELAMAIEIAHKFIFGELQSSLLQRVSVVLDEVVAVGNLLLSDSVSVCVVDACGVVGRSLEALRMSTKLPQCAAIDVGPATGGFVGATHVRYDVWGEAVRTARIAINFAETGELLLTDSARHVAHDALEVREGPTMDGIGSAEEEQLGLWVFCSCSEDSLAEAESQLNIVPTDTKNSRTAKPLPDQLNQSNFLGASKFGVIERAVRLTDEVKADKVLDRKLAMRSAWFAYMVFADPDTEASFVEERQRTMLARAGPMWLGYAALVLVLQVVLVADLDEHRGGIAVVLMTLVALLSVGVAVLAGRIGEDDIGKHTVWCVVSLLVPILTVFAGAVGRPSAIGNDMRHLVVIGAIVRGPSFRHARHQLVVVPILAIVFHTHLLLPGSFFQLPSLFFLALVAFVMVTDQENDMSQRHHFIAEQEIITRLKQLETEETVRHGLLPTVLPLDLIDVFTKVEVGKVQSSIQPETAVILVTRLPTVALSEEKETQQSQHRRRRNPTVEIEEALQQCPSLTIAKIFGDNVLIVNPIAGAESVGRKITTEAELERGCDILRLASLLRQRDPKGFQLIVEVDTTTQLLENMSGLPSFKVMGTAVSRALAIGSCVAAMLPGLLLTERAQRTLTLSSALEESEHGPWTERSLPSWRVRGIGMVRLIQLDGQEGSSQ